MKFFLFITLLAATSASPLSVNQRSRCEDSESYRANITASPFVNIMNVRIDTPEAVYSTPAVVLIGKHKEVVRCKVEDPTVCEVLFNTDDNVYGLHIVGEHIYAGTSGPTLYRCNLNKKDSCKIFQKCALGVMALASEKGFLYVGFFNGTISRCRLNEPNSCRPLHVTGSHVFSLISFNGNLYAGLSDGRLMKCSLETENSCTLLYTVSGEHFMGLSNVNNSLFAATLDGRIWNCTEKSDGATDVCTYVSQTYDALMDIAYFNDVLYIAQGRTGFYKCKGANNSDCTQYANIERSRGIAFAYGTYEMQSRFKGETKSCQWQNNYQCPPYVTYNNEDQREQQKVHIEKGKLYNSLGVLVDTSHADRGSSGPAAIFAMGPDGKVLLSNQHKPGLLHISSFFAGNPVSGAGEIVVQSGVIKKISACSDHYQSDVTLNRQVVQSLRSQGYADPITSVMCGEAEEGQDEELGQTESNYDP